MQKGTERMVRATMGSSKIHAYEVDKKILRTLLQDLAIRRKIFTTYSKVVDQA